MDQELERLVNLVSDSNPDLMPLLERSLGSNIALRAPSGGSPRATGELKRMASISATPPSDDVDMAALLEWIKKNRESSSDARDMGAEQGLPDVGRFSREVPNSISSNVRNLSDLLNQSGSGARNIVSGASELRDMVPEGLRDTLGDFWDASEDVASFGSTALGRKFPNIMPSMDEIRANYQEKEDGSTDGHWGAVKTLLGSMFNKGASQVVEPVLEQFVGKPARSADDQAEYLRRQVEPSNEQVANITGSPMESAGNQVDLQKILRDVGWKDMGWEGDQYKEPSHTGATPMFKMGPSDTIKNDPNARGSYSRDTNTDGLDAIRNRILETPGERRDRELKDAMAQRMASEREAAMIRGLSDVLSSSSFVDANERDLAADSFMDITSRLRNRR